MRNKIWYLAPTAISGIVSIASIPILIYFIGTAEWAQIALGQSVGMFGSVIVGLGWPVVGPALIARLPVNMQYKQFVVSLWARVGVSAVVIAGILGVFLLLSHQSYVLILTAVAGTLLGCTSNWYYLGIDDPRGLFWNDAVVRALGAVMGLICVALTRSGEWYAAGLILGLSASVYLALRKAQSRCTCPVSSVTVLEVWRSVWAQSRGLSTNVLYIAIASVALPLTAFIGGPLFVAFAVLDKVQKQLLTLSLPVTQMITGTMAGELGKSGELGKESAVLTATRMLKRVLTAGIFLIIVMLPISPLAVRALSVDSVSLDAWQTVALAIGVGLAFIAQCLPVAVLALVDKLSYSVVGMSIALVVGVPLILMYGADLGLVFVLWVVCLMYAITISACFAGFWKASRRSIATSGHSEG